MQDLSSVGRWYPQRIVCLAAEAPEILDRLGAFDRVVGVSGFARRPPQVRTKPKVGGFADPDLEKIRALRPDLVIGISDLQADALARLVRQGFPVLALNPHRLEDVWRNILLVGGAVGLQSEAERLAASLQETLRSLRDGLCLPRKPRVFFEEWPDPLISGIGWVGELIELLGGEDAFPELREQIQASGRIVTMEEVAARRPDVIIASWCGKKADLAAIRQRPAWRDIPAVRHGHIYEIHSDVILQVGPSLVEGARQIRQILERWARS
ncbi:MAG: cobalamin-binding protein [Anaerolineae bacterium]|nr:cobalamin-binding protein [Anaerolineae bacterium]